jgi:hypothetical protein
MSNGILSLGFIEFLTRLALKNRKRMGILLIRGGLGNQLHQLAALAYYSKQYDFVPVVYTYDVERSIRDGKFAMFESLNMRSIFVGEDQLRKPSEILRLFLRIHLSLLRRSGKTFALGECELQESRHKPFASQFYIQGFFENKMYAQALDLSTLPNLFLDLKPKPKIISVVDYADKLLLHLRFTDSHTPSDLSHNKLDYYKLLRLLRTKNDKLLVDCFSDDIVRAEHFLGNIKEEFHINFPEKNMPLNSPELLKTFTQYKTIIASDSTLLWWACFIACCCEGRKPVIYCSFSEELKLESWNASFEPLK